MLPTMLPLESTSIEKARAALGSPGINVMLPAIITTKPAPADRLASFTHNVQSLGAPSRAGSSVNWLLLYSYSIGESSSRRLEQATYDDVAFRYLAADQHPDHDTIASFRQQHLECLGGLFLQALRLCQKAGLVKLGHIAIDGTKVEANASKRKSMSYVKLTEQERYWKRQVEAMLRRAAEVDEEEAAVGQHRTTVLPAELAGAQIRLKRLEQAKRELEQEAQRQLEEAQQEWSSRAKHGRRPRTTLRLTSTVVALLSTGVSSTGFSELVRWYELLKRPISNWMQGIK